MHTIAGLHDVSTYIVGVRISGVDVGGYEVAGAPGLARNGFIALLGREFLTGRTFLYEGRGGTFSVDLKAAEDSPTSLLEG